MPEENSTVWNSHIGSRSYDSVRNGYQQAILAQYEVYVEMADRTSQRRSLTNTFFLTLNAALVTVVTTFLPARSIDPGWLIFPLLALLVQCASWFLLIRSYRMLNSSKYKVIHEFEKRLPASPWQAEWNTLITGAGVARYWRLTRLEQWTPAVFAAIYISAFCSYIFR